MNQRKKSTIVLLIIGLAIAVGVVLMKWPIQSDTQIVNGVEKKIYTWSYDESLAYMLCDGFFVTGVLVFGMGALKAFRNKGTFDVLSYGVSSLLYTAIPMLDRRPEEQRTEGFYDYTQRKQAERKPAGDILIAGGVYLVLAAIMLVIYLIIGY